MRTFALAAEKVVVGSGAGSDLRLPKSDLEERHLRFVATSFGHRVEPVRPGATIEVNGEALFCKDLEPGDVISIGSAQLRWLGVVGPGAAAPVEPAGPAPEPAVVPERPAVASRPARFRRPARRGVSTWLPISALFLVVVGTIALVLRGFAGSTWPHSPQHYVDLARAQASNMQAQRALDTLDFALRDATGAAREEALALRDDILRMQAERALVGRIASAQRGKEQLDSFVARYLQADAGRPAARELVRLADAWRAEHADVCAQHSQGPELLAAVAALRQRFADVAELAQPDTAADVVFAARSRLRFQWRDYRGALEVLDRHLAANADEVVRRARDELLTEGEAWLLGKLRGVDQLLARGDERNARMDLEQLERWSVVPQWREHFEARWQRLSGG